MVVMEIWSRSPCCRVSLTERRLTSSTVCIRPAISPTLPIISPRVPVAVSTARRRTSPFWAVCVSVTLICWIEAEVWSTLAASASAFRARCCIWEAISTMVLEVSSVELDWASAPRAIWVVLAEISSALVATVREEVEIWPTIPRRFFTICRIECSSQPISSRDWLRMSAVRSPFETCSARTPRLVSGSAMSRASRSARPTPRMAVTSSIISRLARASL